MTGLRLIVAVSALVVVSFLPGRASAQSDGDEAPAATRSRTATVTPEEIKLFADLTGDSSRTIAFRLAHDPLLGPLIVTAADARKSRKRVGLGMTIVGFTILGVGDIVGSAIMLSTPGYPNIQGHEDQFYRGALIAAGSLVVGLLIGVPGIVKMAAPSNEETAALEYYSPSRSQDLSLRPSPATVSPRTFSFSLLSATF